MDGCFRLTGSAKPDPSPCSGSASRAYGSNADAPTRNDAPPVVEKDSILRPRSRRRVPSARTDKPNAPRSAYTPQLQHTTSFFRVSLEKEPFSALLSRFFLVCWEVIYSTSCKEATFWVGATGVPNAIRGKEAVVKSEKWFILYL